MGQSAKIVFQEPFKLLYDLSKKKPFASKLAAGKGERAKIEKEIDDIKKELGPIAEIAGKNVFIKSKELGILKKLALYPKALYKKRNYCRDSLYAAWRLLVVKRIQDYYLTEKNKIPIAEILALYKAEGDLNLPFSYRAYELKMEPNPLVKEYVKSKPVYYTPYGGLAGQFHSFNQTFYLEKAKPYVPLVKRFAVYTEKYVRTREEMLKEIKKTKSKDKLIPLIAFQTGKLAAHLLFMLSLGGLDFYAYRYLIDTEAIIKETESFETPVNVFAYHYARNRVRMKFSKDFKTLKAEAEAIFEKTFAIDESSFKAGNLWESSMVCGLYSVDSKTLHHHFFPYDPVEYGSMIITEAVARLRSFQIAPLICGGKEFDPPLSPTLAYIRYNAWDIYFGVFISTIVYKVLFKYKVYNKHFKLIKQKMKGFKKKHKAWNFLREWNKKNEYLHSEYVRRRISIRQRLTDDALSGEDYPGTEEKAFKNELNDKAKMDSVIELLEAIDGKTWEAVEKVLLYKIGGEALIVKINKEIGLNVVRFHNNLKVYMKYFTD